MLFIFNNPRLWGIQLDRCPSHYSMDMLLNYWCTLTMIKQVTNQNHWANTQWGTKLYVKKTFCTYCSTEQNHCNWTSLNFRLRAPPLSVQLCVVNLLCCDWSGQVICSIYKALTGQQWLLRSSFNMMGVWLSLGWVSGYIFWGVLVVAKLL